MLYEQFINNINNLIGDSINVSNDFSTPTIALAVSGGSDSIALLMLAHKWAKSSNINLIVISIDHHLRSNSKLENEYVRNLSHKLGYSHYQLHFDSKNNFSNLQARAREARYKLMTELCIKLDILTLFTAHHLDDYIENYCIRSEKKSSVFGLSSHYIIWYNNIRIVRPLFNIPKQQLTKYLITNNIKWFEDETNLSNKYLRNVIRKRLNIEGENKKTQIIKEQLAVNQQVEEQLHPEFIACIAEAVQIYGLGFALIDLLKFTEFFTVVKKQVISFTLNTISGKNYQGRTDAITRINELLQQPTNFTKTLHGCIIRKINDHLIVYREFGRHRPTSIPLINNCIWDNRFLFNLNYNIVKLENKKYFIDNLTVKNYSEIRNNLDLTSLKNRSFKNHMAILFTLPIIKILEKVIAIPHLSYYNDESLEEEMAVCFYPSFVSRFTHFY
ncbi:tRNA lysidine(34) synthetase TilS [Candidatus Tisiphia endosymbiont of Beris chalybata]|uniref:tRNA lysidine(34) synthetase TilS n=1 Tax=Candidatus Tisiphia endosymbiont of Beris chalybata TaxID=3066262 RepID=UPI00312CB88A